MAYQRSAQTDQRRRRVLLEESSAQQQEESDPAAAPTAKRARAKSGHRQSYANNAKRENQARVTDLIPIRRYSLFVLVGLLLIAVTAIELLYMKWLDHPSWINRSQMIALNSNARGSLASWFGAFLFGCSAVFAMLIYNVRQHKADDYRAHYRIWFYSALVMMIVSIDIVTGLHQALSTWVSPLLPASYQASNEVMWMAICSAVGSLWMLRMAIEIRRCRWALLLLGFAIAGYTAAAVLHLGETPVFDPSLEMLSLSTLLLLAHASIALVVVTYARYVMLEASGAISTSKPKANKSKTKAAKRKPARTKTAGTAAKANAADKQKRIAKTPRKTSTNEPKRKAGSEPVEDESIVSMMDAEDSGVPARKLSKAERRRLRKQQRQNRAA